MCSVVAQMDGEEVRVLDEIVLKRASTERRARSSGTVRGACGRAGDVCGRERGAAADVGNDGLRDLEEVCERAAYGGVRFQIPKANPAVRDRVTLMNAKLESAAGERKLMVHPRCKELIKDFEQVMYKENSQVIDKDRDPKRTHLSDALGYLVWQECRPGMKIGDRDRPLF